MLVVPWSANVVLGPRIIQAVHKVQIISYNDENFNNVLFIVTVLLKVVVSIRPRPH